MPSRSHSTLAAACAAGLCWAAAAPALAASAEVGTAAAVNADTFGTPPDTETRLIYLGTAIVFEEQLETGEAGSAQVLFLDKSTVTLGPNSRLAIDRYVYDPVSGTGEAVMSLTKGVMRFVGGQISKSESGVTIRTPTATVGIRGGIGIIRQSDSGTRAIFVAGDGMSIASGGDPGISITRPGGSATVAGDGRIDDTGLASSAEIAQANGETQGNGGGGLDGDGPSDGSASQGLGEGLAGNDETLSAPPASVGDTSKGSGAPAGDPTGEDMAALFGDAVDGNRTFATQQTGPDSRSTASSSSSSGSTGGRAARNRGGTGTSPATTDPAKPRTTTFGGRLVATPESGYTDSFGGQFSDPAGQFVLGGPDARFDLGVTAYIENGRWVASTTSGSVNLPVQDGTFAVGTGNATTPFGPATGTGFHDAADNFAFYALTTARTDYAQRLAIWGGTPTPDGGNSSGTGSISFQAYTLASDPFRGGTIPLVPSDAAALFTSPSVSKVFVLQNASGDFVREAGFANDGGPQSKIAQFSLAIEGQGGAQKSLIYGTVGEPHLSAEGKILVAQSGQGMIRTDGSSRSNAIFAGFYSREGADGAHFYGPQRDYFVVRNNSIFAGDDQPDLEYDSVGYSRFDTTVQAEREGALHLARRTDTPAGLGSSRTTRDLAGYAAAIGETMRPNAVTVYPAPYLLSNLNDLPGSVRLRLDATSNAAGMTMTLADGGVVGTDVNSMVLGFGGTNALRGAFLDDDTYAMLNAQEAGATQLAVAPGVNGSAGLASAFDPYGFRSVALSGAAVPADELLTSGVAFCACAYMEWGWWAAEFRQNDTSAGVDGDRREHIHLGSFVAGKLPDLGDIPSAGTASFNGHAAGNVFNNGDLYVAVGTFAGSWSFADDSGTIDITDFDGQDYTGIPISAPNRRDFTGTDGTVTTPVGAGQIDVNGSLFEAGADPAGAMAGKFRILDSGGTIGDVYRAIGTFVGENGGS